MTISSRVNELWDDLHAMPEVGFEEIKTSGYLAEKLRAAGYQVRTGVGGTGVVGTLQSVNPGKVVALRADMDALAHTIAGKDCALHSCGHDAHSAMVLTVAEEIGRRGLKSGTLKILFQPAEEILGGALKMVDDGAIDDVDVLLGIHLRPIQEAKLGQATPALYHGSSYIMEANLKGMAAHGARPHLGVNVIDAAAAVIGAVNAIHMNPTIPSTVKVTKLQAGGAALNAIPESAYMALDLRSQENPLMEELIKKTTRAIEAGAATVGAEATIKVKGGVPAAEYDKEMIELARRAITAVLGSEGLLEPIVTPGGEDFHYFVKKKPSLQTGYLGLGCDLTPGLHHPEMKFDHAALENGVKILLHMVGELVSLN
ncbi:MAG: M20 peptidase aminoacylase family protein [Negativicutes bacterium]|nr:M20 peptidase aminoacylase family protein [Negativicutes bacterium]